MKVVYGIFVFLFLSLSFKIIYLQVFRQSFFADLARRQHYGLFPIQGKRGRILDRNQEILARSFNFYSLFADPFLVDDKESHAQILSEELDICRFWLYEQLSRENRRFVWLKRKIEWSQKEKLEKMNLSGIGFVREDQRFYPEAGLFSCVLGRVDIDNNGLEGIELYYDRYLRGKQTWVRAIQDASSKRLILSPFLVKLQKGADLILSLDTRIQYWAKKYLQEQVEEYQAKRGMVVVMNAESGEILALANFDREDITHPEAGRSFTFRRNAVVTDMFEPGSVFKITTLVAAIAEGVSFETIYCEDGAMRIPGTTLRDWRPYQDLSFEEVFYKSSNIGVAKIAKSISDLKTYEYIRRLGFGKRSGIDFPGETAGKLRPVSNWSRTSGYIVPMGQEIGVNLLQLARAFAVVANGGYLITPHLAKAVCHQQSCQELEFSKENVLPSGVAERAKSILIGAVEQGTGQRAALKGEEIGGKTGTAQKFDVELGRYSPNRYKANFVGFVSSTKQPIVIAVSIDEPKVSHFGGVVAAPLFRKIAEKVLAYD